MSQVRFLPGVPCGVDHRMPVQWLPPLITEERPELRRTAHNLRLPPHVLISACAGAGLVSLTDSLWETLQNTESFGIRSLAEATEVARRYGRDCERILVGLHRRGPVGMPAPIVLAREGKKPYLVAGNTRLCLCRALRVTPQVLWVTL